MRTMTRKELLLIAFMAAVFALIGAIVGLVVTSSGGNSASLRNLTLQPSDLPSEFVLTDEKLYSREELMAELPAQSQIAEAGLQEAVHLTYESQDDVPMVIDVFLYGYDDEAAADAAHAYAVESDWMHLLLRRLTELTDAHATTLSGGLAEDIGEDGVSMAGEVDLDDDSTVPVSAYMMRSGSARAEVVMAGESIFVTPDRVARNQYLRLERPDAVAAP
jgi:hypothetical protein